MVTAAMQQYFECAEPHFNLYAVQEPRARAAAPTWSAHLFPALPKGKQNILRESVTAHITWSTPPPPEEGPTATILFLSMRRNN